MFKHVQSCQYQGHNLHWLLDIFSHANQLSILSTESKKIPVFWHRCLNSETEGYMQRLLHDSTQLKKTSIRSNTFTPAKMKDLGLNETRLKLAKGYIKLLKLDLHICKWKQEETTLHFQANKLGIGCFHSIRYAGGSCTSRSHSVFDQSQHLKQNPHKRPAGSTTQFSETES